MPAYQMNAEFVVKDTSIALFYPLQLLSAIKLLLSLSLMCLFSLSSVWHLCKKEIMHNRRALRR